MKKQASKVLFKLATVCLTSLTFLVMYLCFQNLLKNKNKIESEPWLIKKYGFNNLKKAYPNWDDSLLHEFLRETSDWPMLYEPFTGIQHAEKAGQFINYSISGFRESPEKNIWPPDPKQKNIFVFGGSTVLGAGVSDAKTIPSFLQRQFGKEKINVYNFGRGFYFSTQEKILFFKLLEEIAQPNLVIFFHGLNDFYFYDGKPEFTEKIENLFLNDTHSVHLWKQKRNMNSDEKKVELVVKRLLENRRQIMGVCKEYGIGFLEVIQPVPLYQYPSNLFIIPAPSKQDFGRHYLQKLGYEKLARKSDFNKDNKNLLNLSNLLAQATQISYCDLVHYTEKTNELIAKEIHNHILKNFDEF